MQLLLWTLAIAVLGAALLVRSGVLAGQPPAGLGVAEGRLSPPSATPNSVHSQAALYPSHPQSQAAAIAPLPLVGDGPATIARLKSLVESTPGARVVDCSLDYLRAEFATRWLGFVDDAEFWVDPAAGVVQVRSASRIGRRDFGVNRARIESLRARLQAAG